MRRRQISLQQQSIWFTFEFIRSNDLINAPINASINIDLTKIEKQILELLRCEERHTKGELAEKIGKSIATVQRAIGSLTEKGLIERIGSNKVGYWVVKSKK